MAGGEEDVGETGQTMESATRADCWLVCPGRTLLQGPGRCVRRRVPLAVFGLPVSSLPVQGTGRERLRDVPAHQAQGQPPTAPSIPAAFSHHGEPKLTFSGGTTRELKSWS